jgi:hypothetical protein
MSFLSQQLLDSYLGRHIDEICPTHYEAANHCAHFVSHVLNLKFGYTCGSGRNVRVHEVFSSCNNIEELAECRHDYGSKLLFVTGSSHVHSDIQSMDNVPKKHIGMVIGAFVWHYSNSHHKVVKEVVDHFIYHYPKQSERYDWSTTRNSNSGLTGRDSFYCTPFCTG